PEVGAITQGTITQIGRPRHIYEHPANQFVADFVGNTNFLDGTVACHDGSGGYVVRTEIGDMHVKAALQMNTGDRIAVSFRPEDVELTETQASGENIWPGTVEQKVF